MALPAHDGDEPLLRRFFSDNFPESWVLSAVTADEVIERYRRRAPNDAAAVANALLRFSNRHPGDEALVKALVFDFGCLYDPIEDWGSARAWLRHVARLLRGC
jgi:hypothetical protein